MGAIEEIAAERRRQIEAEGWMPAHDDQHRRGELASAAACYAYAGSREGRGRDGLVRPPYAYHDGPRWPWAVSWWKPRDRRRDLVRAGALIVAEIERLDRETAAEAALDAAYPEPSA